MPLLVALLALTLPGAAVAAEESSTISGTVTAEATGLAVQGVDVCVVLKTDSTSGKCVKTDVQGEYTTPGLIAGEWDVFFYVDGLGLGLEDQVYDHHSQSGPFDPVVLDGIDPAEGIDAALWSGGAIAGTVTSAGTGLPLPEVRVCLVEARIAEGASAAETVGCLKTSGSGEYRFENVPLGSYKVAFSPELADVAAVPGEGPFTPDGYLTQWWKGGANFATAAWISPDPPATTSGTDAALKTPLVPSQPAGSGSSGSSSPDVSPVVVAKPPTHSKPLHCRRGFAKRQAKGKARCVKQRKPARHRAKHPKSH